MAVKINGCVCVCVCVCVYDNMHRLSNFAFLVWLSSSLLTVGWFNAPFQHKYGCIRDEQFTYILFLNLSVQWHPVRPIITSVASGVVSIWAQNQVVSWFISYPFFGIS